MAERILFVTGRLAEFALRRVVERLSREVKFEYDIAVLGITVAALMHAEWVRKKLRLEKPYDRVVLPGWCQGDPEMLAKHFQTPFEVGPKDLHDLPEYFGRAPRAEVDLSREPYDIEMLAEINHAPRLSDAQIVEAASAYRDSGADVIDLGCIPGESWSRAKEVTRILVREGFRVSIDSFDRAEVEGAVEAGAELVLSANSRNIDWVAGLGAEVVAIPDDPKDAESLARTVDALSERGCRFRIDPVLEPIGFGFAASLGRYYEARRRFPDAEMMMGIGNLTELTAVDSAGLQVILAAICQELGIRSVLTTQVINWARSAVREFDLARRLVRYSQQHQVLPKQFDASLVMLRDPKVREMGEEELVRLAERLSDPNFRIFVERGEIHLMNREGYWRGTDPFELFDRATAVTAVDPPHAFYLGYELAKAVTALTLGKQYNQDQALTWGFLTVPEKSAHERRRAERRSGERETGDVAQGSPAGGEVTGS